MARRGPVCLSDELQVLGGTQPGWGGLQTERHPEAAGAPAVTAGKQAEPGGHWVFSQTQGKSSSQTAA